MKSFQKDSACILKVQGQASAFVKRDINNLARIYPENQVLIFTALSEFNVCNGEILKVYNLKSKKILGKVKLIEVYLPFNRIWNCITEGHRAISKFEIIEGAKETILKDLETHSRFEFIENKIFLFQGNFEELFDKYYV